MLTVISRKPPSHYANLSTRPAASTSLDGGGLRTNTHEPWIHDVAIVAGGWRASRWTSRTDEMLNYLKSSGCRNGQASRWVLFVERGLLWYDENGASARFQPLQIPRERVLDTTRW